MYRCVHTCMYVYMLVIPFLRRMVIFIHYFSMYVNALIDSSPWKYRRHDDTVCCYF